MCGIFGAINLAGIFDKTDYDRFVKLTDMVSYRGPDVSGYNVFNIKESSFQNKDRFNVFLGHRRLSIVDLSSRGDQPFTDGDGLWIIHNGEVFNYIELRENLKSKGYPFKSKTDTEVILSTYREYGESGFDSFNGMWAFAILDIPNKKIVLSRDRFSIKPLYYTVVDKVFVFSSEIKQLLPLLSKRDLQRGVMFAYLSQGLLDHNEKTFYQGIYRVKPKTNLIINLANQKIEEKEYWNYSLDDKDGINDIIGEFRELLTDSIRIRFRSDVKVGALLSGGLDSSVISVVANTLENGNFETYSVISGEEKYSEARFIDILTRGNKIRNIKLCYKQADAQNSLNEVVYHNEEPFGSLSVIAQYKMFEKIKKETDTVVVLCGQGGDELLLGYLKYFFFYLKDLFTTGKWFKGIEQILLSCLNRTVLWQFRYVAAKRYLPAYLPFLSRNRKSSYIEIHGDYEPLWKCADMTQRQIIDIDQYSVPALTHYEDRNSMAHSLETRLPFLDHRLVNFALGLPIKMKLNKGWTKYILRQSFYELPDAIRWRRDKQGFTTPEEMWLKEHFRGLIIETFKKSVLHEMGIIDSKKFQEYYVDFLTGKKNIWYADIARVFIAELWAKKFLI